MMNQETYVKMQDLRKQGWTIGEIAAETGFHPETISLRLRSGEPPTRRRVPDESLVMNARWRERIAMLIDTYPRLLGVSVHNKLRAEGFGGGYSTVTRELRTVRGPRFRAADAASMPIHTDPGEEAQFDFCDLSDWATRWGWTGRLWCFGMILCWSRWRLWWFTTSVDREHTLRGSSVSSTPSVASRSCVAPIGWGRSVSRRAAGSSCTRRRWSSPVTMAPRSRPVRPATPSARARSSGRSVI